MLIVEPVLMAPLRRRWLALQDEARALAARRDAATGGQRTRLESELRALLSFQDEIVSIRVLDPACGSGNFLYVALKQLLDLEKEVIVFMGEVGLTRPFPGVSPEQLRGIELNEYAHELAQTTVWIGYIQWLRDNGFGQPSEPILKRMDTIRHMDAILAFDDQGRPVEQRDRWLNPEGASEAELKKRTLTNLYNARPIWLQIAHKRLDDAVLDAYGWPRDLGDDEILARLLALNLERAASQGGVAVGAVDGEE